LTVLSFSDILGFVLKQAQRSREAAMKKILVVALIVVSVIVLIGVTKDLALGSIVSFASSNILGAPVKIGGLSVGIFKQSVHIKDLKVYQPKGFP
jgi:hypothetical protein